MTDAVNAGETALVAVEDNYWNKDPKYPSSSAKVVPDWMLPHMRVFGKNTKGQTIICIPTGSYNCGASSEFRLATDQEIENSVKAGAVSIVGSAVGGKGAEYTLKIGGKIVNKYKTIKQVQKAAEDSVRKARVKNNNQIDDDLGNRPLGGEHRANQYSQNWAKASLREVREKFAGKNPVITHTESGKIIHENRDTGIQVVYDKEGDYFTLIDPSIKGTRKYLDLNGNVPSEKTLPNGKKTGRSKSEYREVTHFKVDR